MKKYDVTVKMKHGRGTIDIYLNEIEAENEKIAETLALSYAKSMVSIWVDSIKESK